MKTITSLVKSDVTALEIYDNYLYAGVGNILHVFNAATTKLLHKQIVFDGLRIHGIQLNESRTHILLNAEHELLVLRNNFCSGPNKKDCNILRRIEVNDWILSTKWLQHNNFVLVTMHNDVEFINDEFLTIDSKMCSVKCILYSAVICFKTVKECVILSGTVFSDILIWRPYISSNVYHCIKGHEGVLFSIDYMNNHIVSASDDRSLVLWRINGSLKEPSCSIILLHKMHGHSARVFKCKLQYETILSGGEDGRICVWNYDGNLLKTFNVHHGGSIWALASSGSSPVVYSGGSDASIIQSHLGDSTLRKLNFLEDHIPKKLAILANNHVAVMTEKATLYCYNTKDQNVTSFGAYPEFESYCLIEVSYSRQKIAFAGIRGNIVVFELVENELVKTVEHIIPTRKRIYSLHWLSCNHLLTCGPEGILYLWKIYKEVLLLIGKYELPSSKERWTTSACKIPNGFVVGDRKGHLHNFHVDEMIPLQTLRKAHSHLGITHLHFKPTENILISLGRDATFRSYELTDKHHLVPLIKDTLPFSWLAKQLENDVLLGFSGDEVLLWDLASRMQLFSTSCGGGHRSWDISQNQKNFVYIRDKAIYTLGLHKPLELTSSVHSTEINTLKCVKFPNSTCNTLISGGEDTTLRFFELRDDLQNVFTLKSHLSSIRCLTMIEHHGNYYLFTGGGRGQIISWQILIVEGALKRCKQLDSYYENENEEVRIMDMAAMTRPNGCIFVFAACSNGCIKIFSTNDDMKLSLCAVYQNRLNCILKLAYLPLENSPMLCTMATDGLLTFWSLGDFSFVSDQEPIFRHKCHQSGINSYDFKLLINNSVLFLTGGDDNQICLTLIKMVHHNVFNVVAEYKNAESHCAQITGAYLGDGFFFTASLDQKLLFFKYEVNDELNVNFGTSHTSTISDIKGLQVLEANKEFIVVLYGLGVEVIKVL